MNDGERAGIGETPTADCESSSRSAQEQLSSLAKAHLDSSALRIGSLGGTTQPFDSVLTNIVEAMRPLDSSLSDNIARVTQPLDFGLSNDFADATRLSNLALRNIKEATRPFDLALRNIAEATRPYDLAWKNIAEATRSYDLAWRNSIARATRVFDSLQIPPPLLGVDDYVDVVRHPVIPIYVPTHHKKTSRKEMREILAGVQSAGKLVVCVGCGRLLEVEFLELDHKFPSSDGGEDWIGNRVLLCGPCNRYKSNRLTISGLWHRNRQREWMRDQAAAEEVYNRVLNFVKSLLEA